MLTGIEKREVQIMTLKILFTFVGNRDPYVENTDNEYGPILSHLHAEMYSRVYLICTGPEYFERARTVEQIAQETTDTGKFNFIDLSLQSPVDYEEIYLKLRDTLDTIVDTFPVLHYENTVLLDPGTPQMQTSWFLLVKSGIFKARLVQGVPPKFAGGTYKVRTVNLENSRLPEIVLPKKKKAGLDILFQPNLEGFEKAPGDRWIKSAGIRIAGRSNAFLEAFELAGRFAGYNINVLLFGETGSGKNVFAKYIHENSMRKNKPMSEINCAAIPEQLVESELFGHRKGAFTGADSDRLGLFRTADGGTVFLDEIGELPLHVQPKLLKVIEEKVLMPVGEDKEQHVDVRIIAATNANLEEKITSGDFRRDLYERLNQVNLIVPPLRERGEDIIELANLFLSDWNREYGEERVIGPECWDFLLEYNWPGNVRELENAVQTLCAKSRSNQLMPEALPSRILAYFNKANAAVHQPGELPDEGIDLKAVLYDLEKEYYESALTKAEGNGEQAAKLLGLNGPAFRKACRDRFGLL